MSRPYQDVWRAGVLVERARRNCSDRYDAIAAQVADWPDGFTVADVGGWDGYFLRRLHEDRHTTGLLADSRTPDPDGFELLTMTVTGRNVTEVGDHDLILALSVLHHMPDWRRVLRGLRRQCRLLIVEVPHPAEADAPHSRTMRRARPWVAELHADVTAAGVTICETPALDRPHHLRPTVAIGGAL